MNGLGRPFVTAIGADESRPLSQRLRRRRTSRPPCQRLPEAVGLPIFPSEAV